MSKTNYTQILEELLEGFQQGTIKKGDLTPETLDSLRKLAGIGSVTIVNGKHFGWVGMQHDWYNGTIDNVMYIGRANRRLGLLESPLHNPYKEKEYGREGCIQKFRQRLWEEFKAYRSTKFGTERIYLALHLKTLVEGGENVTLVCHCSPKRCHGEVIRNFIYWAIKEKID